MKWLSCPSPGHPQLGLLELPLGAEEAAQEKGGKHMEILMGASLHCTCRFLKKNEMVIFIFIFVCVICVEVGRQPMSCILGGFNGT